MFTVLMSYYLYFTKLAFRRIIPMIARLKIVNIRDVSVSDGSLEKKKGRAYKFARPVYVIIDWCR